MERLTDREEEDYLKALITGESGTGKTRFGATAPRPLICLSERQGMRTILDTVRLRGGEMPEVLFMRSLQDYRQVLKALHAPKEEPFRVWSGLSHADRKAGKSPDLILEMEQWPQTVVIDSLTDATELVKLEVLAESPPQKGEDNLDVISLRHWGEFRDRALKLVRAFRDVPLHVVFLCLLQEDIRETSNGVSTRFVGPQLVTRTMVPSLMAAVNVAGIMVRQYEPAPLGPDGKPTGDRVIKYGVRTVGPDWMAVKAYRPLRDWEVPDFTSWLESIRDYRTARAPQADLTSEQGSQRTNGVQQRRPAARRGRSARREAAVEGSTGAMETLQEEG